MEYMAFGTAKQVIKSHECWKLHHLGIPVEDIAKEEHITVKEVQKTNPENRILYSQPYA